MKQSFLNPDNTVFIVLSFEGPDVYSRAGGLGIRITHLTDTLAGMGYPVHLFFIGDPEENGLEVKNSTLNLHRWCQWISKYYPRGVYEGEHDKIRDYNKSIPPFVIENVIRPAVREGKSVVVLGEEWHTAETISLLSEQLHQRGIRKNTILFWNANNTFGFDRINWTKISSCARITTVSRYMKRIMQGLGLNPLVVPNGIPSTFLRPVSTRACINLKSLLNVNALITKVARWDPDKNWESAIDVIYHLRADGYKAALLARGGIEPHGEKLIGNAKRCGLNVCDVYAYGKTIPDYLTAIGGASGADIINLRFDCPQQLLKILYHMSDAVLANSRHEPFGLVGLETMAAGGVAVTGGTGEDYAAPYYNSIVLETQDSGEIEDALIYLGRHPEESSRIRANGIATAHNFTWDRIARILIQKLEYQAYLQGIIDISRTIETFEFKNYVAERV